jgi:hypothetical protein
MLEVSPASLQTFIDTPNCVLEDPVQYSTVHIPNVFCDGHLQLINCVGIVRQVYRDFFITLYILSEETVTVSEARPLILRIFSVLEEGFNRKQNHKVIDVRNRKNYKKRLT